MRKIGIYVSSINSTQHEVLSKIIDSGAEVHVFGKINRNKLPKLANVVKYNALDKFCSVACLFDELIHIGDHWLIKEESIVNSFFSLKIKPLFYLDSTGEVLEKIDKSTKSSVLLVFPGSMIPLNLGSHQRVFNLLYQMAVAGVLVDILITTGKNVDKEMLKNTLSFFCNDVYIYKNNKKKLSKLSLLKRFTEKRVKMVKGLDQELPDLFSERLITKPTESCKRWVNSLYLANNYRNIIISYAWMLPSLEYINHDRSNFTLICDTHDVQYIRNKVIFESQERLVFNQLSEKKLELKLLEQCDKILAISESDEKVLKSDIKDSNKVIKVTPGFEYAKLPVKQRPLRTPFRFGFIGGKMDANVQSLLFIIDNWWPAIKKFSPDSKLYIAGSICNQPKIVSRIFLEENIVKLGFVDSLIDFYNNIDVALNPVLVQGGLNFKSVEAVFAGKHLATNSLGMVCLGGTFPSIVVDDASDLVTYLTKIEFDYKLDKSIRQENQKIALNVFGNNQIQLRLPSVLCNEG